MKCVKCGNILEQNASFCSFCGTRVEEEQTALLVDYEATGLLTQNDPAPIYSAETQQNTTPCFEDLTRKEFYNRFASKKTKSWVTAMVVICFLSAGVSLVPLALGNFLSLLDIAFYAAMGALLLSTKNWAFALVPTLYSGVFSLISAANTGSVSGVFAIVAGIMSTIALNKINKAFQAYQKDRILPDGEI